MKEILADIIATYFFGRVIAASHVLENDFGYMGKTAGGEMQVSVFFSDDNRIFIEQYVTFTNGGGMEPDFTINGQTAEAVAAWIRTEERLNATS